MSATRRRGLNTAQIEDQLNESDLELDPYGSDTDDDIYVPDEREHSGEHSSDTSSNDEDNDDENDLSPSLQQRSQERGRGATRQQIRGRVRRRGRQAPIYAGTNAVSSVWQEKLFMPTSIPHMLPTYLPVNTEYFEKIDYFRQYIDTEIMELIVQKTNQMSTFKTGKYINITLPELNVFLGALMIMGAINYPQLKMYWQRQYRVAIIAENISRNRFFLIKNNLKLVFDPIISPEQRSADRIWKMRPLLNKIISGCNKQKKEKTICVDEMIIPFSGRCSMKQYCPNKPNPVGLKAFVLANPNGIVCDFHIYQGGTTYPDYENTNFTLCEKVVLQLAANLMPGHILYFDRYFTTERLVLELKNRDILCAGTLAKNRIPKYAKPLLKSERELRLSGRGSCQVLVNENTKIALTTWLDNKPVTLLSSIHANATSDNCQRWCKKQKVFMTVSRPEVVKAYNTNMGGVDLADRLLSVCPFRYRTVKWTQRFFAHMIDLATCNAWLQYRQDELAKNVPLKKIQQLRAFKIELGHTLIESGYCTDTMDTSSCESTTENNSRKRGRQFVVQIPTVAKRRRGTAHMPILSQQQNICRRRGCPKKTKMTCSGCKIHLCVTYERNCFVQFHSD